MLCSVPAGKPSSNWLDRLRSTKGFPIAGDVGLDDFLLTNPNADDETSDSPTSDDAAASNSLVNSNSVVEQAPEISGRDVEGEYWFGVMTNALSDLFYMGRTTGISRKKSARKQTNPKFCALPEEKAAGATTVTASLNSNRNSNIVRPRRGGDDVDEGDEEKEKDECRRGGDGEGCGGDRELKGYSRSEVTVIDTSYEVWKFDKLVFRKKNVWKVRDKKGKSWMSAAAAAAAKKKRKKGSGGLDSEYDHGSVSGGAKKKAKVLNFCSTVVANGGNCVPPSDDGQKLQDETMEEVPREVGDELSQVPRINRVHGSRSPRISEKGNSSVVLIKAMPSSKKSGENVPKNQLKERQRPQKA
ncbi:unnamed protein product [Linum trigynum]|uniref:Uncharacterized protein n=1 Tax=Linum trigynum TaxID=586398 RepID=A0AAV2D4K9_9ROSI